MFRTLNKCAAALNVPFRCKLDKAIVMTIEVEGNTACNRFTRSLEIVYPKFCLVLLQSKTFVHDFAVNFARIVPDGLLVFFPSYHLLNTCIEAWQSVVSIFHVQVLFERELFVARADRYSWCSFWS
jgi:hypothetical protein